jgi:elongation factor 1-alpha
LSSELTLQRTSLGLQLNILHPRSGFHCAIDWSAADSEEVDLSLVETIQSALTTLPFAPSSAASPASPSSASHLDAHTQRLAQMFESDGGGGGARDGKEISFPCILLRANFDPFTIIRNSSLFTMTSLFSAETSGYQFTPHSSAAVSVYCMEDIWDLLCFSSNQYLPGQDFPVTSSLCSNSSTAVALASLRNEKQLQQQHRPNMVMALGHTPLLFNLYLERSCLYQSCLNVTGDLMAFASTSYQWAKLFYDCFYFIHHITRSLSKRQRQSPSAATAAEAEAVGSSETKGEDSLPTAAVGAEEEEEEEKECLSPEERVSMIRRLRRTHVEVGLMALVSYSYACESKQTLPSKNTVLDMFSLSQTNASEAKATAAAGVGAESPYKIFSRDSLPGLTCPLAFSTLLATSSLYAFSNDPTVWNSLLLTLFSRFCEAISGNKIIRNQNPLVADLRELEESYRLCIGQIQTLFQRRLYVEWPKLDHTEKLHLISLCANDLNKILKTIVNTFLSEFSRYGLPLWSEMIALMETCLSLQRQRAAAAGAATRAAAAGGVACLRELYSHCDAKLNLVIDDLVSQASEQQQQQLCLPVVRQLQHSGAGDSDGDEWSLCLQEMDPQSDLEELLGYVEAILATKVSPKIEYKPVTKPQHPSINTSLNRELQFRVNSQPASWNTANPVVNIGLIGNVNSGKSTLCGRILYDLGIVDKHLVDRLSEEAKRMGYTADLRHAWLLDNLQAERSRNVTMVSKFKGFETSLRRYNLIDNPGHKDFLCSATEGIFQTDIALLVVSAVESERHISSLVTNFTEEFLINAFCYSIRHLIVIINKMDATSASASVSAAASASGGAPGGGSGGGEGSVSGGYAEAEYQAACESVKKHLKKAGYKINNSNTVQFVPISALRGVGIVSSSVEMPWYHGPCLLQLLDEVVIPKRQVEKPLRMIVSEVHKVSGVGVVLCGKVECGTVSVGDTLSCFPELHTSVPPKGKQRNNKKKTCAAAAAVTATALKASSSRGALLKVKSIEAHHVSLPSASAGDNIGIAISSSGSGSGSGNEAISIKSFSKGMILTLSSAPPVPVFIHFEAQLILLKKITIHSGYCPTLLINSNHVPVKITRLLSLIDKNNSVLETFPASVTQSQICICEMMAEKPFAAESIHELPKLSKFLIRQNRLIVAIGFIRGPVS